MDLTNQPTYTTTRPPHKHSVPVSQDEDADTEVVRTWGTPRTGDDLLHHHDLLWCVFVRFKWLLSFRNPRERDWGLAD